MKLILFITILSSLIQFSEASNNPFLSGEEEKTGVEEMSDSKSAEPPFWYPIVIWQKAINDKLATILGDLKENPSPTKVLLVFFISLFYSLLHTAGPGHGKLILGTYFLTSGRERKRKDALIAGVIVSVTHIGMAFLLSLILYVVIQSLSMGSQRELANISRRIGGSFVILTGVVLMAITLFRSKIPFLNSTKNEEKFSKLSLYSIAVLSGIVPCPLAWFVLVFTLSFNIYVFGIISIIGMAIGAAITVGSTGYIILIGREKAMNLIGGERAEKIAYGLRFMGGLVLFCLGILMVMPY